MKLTYNGALRMLGVLGFELKNSTDYARLMDIWREATVQARQKQDDVLAADLSQCKEAIKKRWTSLLSKVCPRCSGEKKSESEYCGACRNILRKGGTANNEADKSDLYQVVGDVFITATANGQRSGVLVEALRRLQVGDSFMTDKSPTSVANAAKTVGFKTICRKINCGETDKKKFRFRVWRTDGKKPSEVNQIIRLRLDAQHALPANNPPGTPTDLPHHQPESETL